MASPTPNSVHVPTTAKPAPPAKKLSMAQLKAVLEKLITMMQDEAAPVVKAYKSEHAARQLDPATHKVVGSKQLTDGIRALFAIQGDKSVIQSLRFDAEKFTPDAAKAWLKAHNYSTAQFEAAIAKQMQDCAMCGNAVDADEFTEVDGQMVCVDCAEEMQQVQKATYSDESWATPSSDLDTNSYCSVCLVDENLAGAEKIKAKCHLPVRKTPGGSINKAALRNASARLEQTQMSAASKATAKRKLARMMTQAGIESNLNKEDVNIEATVEVLKSDDELRVSYGVAYPMFPPGVVDSQRDFMSESAIRDTAWRYLSNSARYDMHHTKLDVAKSEAVVVESYLAPIDFDWPKPDGTVKHIVKGSWIVATHYPDPDVWARVRKGEFGAYSIRGKGKRKPVVV